MSTIVPLPAGFPPQVEDFGNHHRKFLKAWNDGGGALVEALERAGLSDRVPLDRPFDDPLLELHHVCAALGGHGQGREVMWAMSAYYATQFLRMNAEAVSALALRAAAAPSADPLQDDRFPKLIDMLERRFRALSRGFMHHTLVHHARGAPLPPFAVLFVGAMSDHEDLDIAVIAQEVDGDKGLAAGPSGTFSAAMARTQTSFFRHAQKLDPHLSQYIPGQRIWADVDEYKEILGQDLKNFVVVSQVIGAGFLVGDRKLFARFRAEVHRRYFSKGDDARFHEGFVRGAIAELRYLLAAHHSPSVINPKAEVYRLIKMLVAALRTVFGVEGHNAVRGLQDLVQVDPDHAQHYTALARAYAFNEVLRYLYALFVVQEDEIHLENAEVQAPLDHIASLMGFSGADRLVHAYDENLTATLRAGRVLAGLLGEHLRESSYFHRAFREGRLSKDGDAAQTFLKLIRGFDGKVFWDDIVDLLRERPSLLADISEDLAALDEATRRRLVTEYVQMMAGELTSLMRLLTVIAARARDDRDRALAYEFLDAVIAALEANPEQRSAYFEFCYEAPGLLHRVISLYPPDRTRRLMRVVSEAVDDPRRQGTLHRHKALRALAFGHSKYLGRFIDKVLRARPHFIEVVDDFRRARGMARRVLAEAAHCPQHQQRIRVLGEYYDLEFVRTAVHALIGQAPDLLEEGFRVFTDVFIQSQFTAVVAKVMGEDAEFDLETSLADFGFFATGGNARGEAFHDDYDYIAVVDSDDEARIDELNRVVAGAHLGILKQALVPHNRLIEHFGRYVVSLSELDAHLSEERDDLFIDQSEMLDSRLVVGDPKMSWRFAKRIMVPHVYGRRDSYCTAMVRELNGRHLAGAGDASGIALKEGPGGLRDINMLLLVLKGASGVKAPLSLEVWDKLADRMDNPTTRDLLGELSGHYRFIKRLRDLYRLSVAYDEIVSPAHFDELLEATAVPELGDDPEALAERAREEMAAARGCIARILEAEGLASA